MSDRRRDLAATLDRQLDSISKPEERLLWLSNHLIEYVDRLIGFAELPDVTLQSVLQSDHFVVVALASERVRNEVVSHPFTQEVVAAAERPIAAVSRLAQAADPVQLKELRSSTQQLQDMVSRMNAS